MAYTPQTQAYKVSGNPVTVPAHKVIAGVTIEIDAGSRIVFCTPATFNAKRTLRKGDFIFDETNGEIRRISGTSERTLMIDTPFTNAIAALTTLKIVRSGAFRRVTLHSTATFKLNNGDAEADPGAPIEMVDNAGLEPLVIDPGAADVYVTTQR